MRVFGPILLVLIAVALHGFLFGFPLLDPYRISWLTDGDPAQAFFGFNFWLHTPWSFPPGYNPLYNAPLGSSLVYTDSIPWISLIAKWFFSNSSEPVQFQGPWILACLIAQGLTAEWVLFRETRSAAWAFAGSLLFLFFPAFFFRTLGSTVHYSLLAHFLVILSLGEVFRFFKRHEFSRPRWGFLLALALGIHFYLFAMVGFLYLSVVVSRKFEWKSEGMLGILLGFLSWFLGYGSVSAGDSTGTGFGAFAMDFTSWFSPVSLGPEEGYQFWGAGVILGLLWVFWSKRSRFSTYTRFLRQHPGATSVFASLFLLTLSRRFWVAGYRMGMPPTILLWVLGLGWLFGFILRIRGLRLLGLLIGVIGFLQPVGVVLRSTGRIGWVFSYFLLFFLVLSLQKKKRWRSLLLLLVVQSISLGPVFARVKRDRAPRNSGAGTQEDSSLEVDRLIRAIGPEGAQASRIVFFSSPGDPGGSLTLAAIRLRIPMGPLYLARYSESARMATLEEFRSRVLKGTLKAGSVVAIHEGESVLWDQARKNPLFHCIEVAGFRLISLKAPN